MPELEHAPDRAPRHSVQRQVGLSRFAAGGRAALGGNVAVSVVECALDCPACFGYPSLSCGILRRGHSS
jgi:hypothetical protein